MRTFLTNRANRALKYHGALALLIVVCATASALAAEAQSVDVEADRASAASPTDSGDFGSADEEWQFVWTPYVWASDLDADVTVKGVSSESQVEFGDIVDVLEFAATSHLEARKDRWSVLFDLLYLKVGDDESLEYSTVSSIGPLRVPARVKANVDFELEQIIAELAVGYRVYERLLADHELERKRREFALELLAGARYVYLETTIDIEADARIGPVSLGPLTGSRVLTRSLDRELSGSKDWLDPIIGARAHWDMTEDLSLVLRGDVGGFGLGSELTWNAAALADWRLTEHVSLYGGYRVLDIDYEDGSGDDKFVFDAQIKGPLFGILFHF
ncbi:hypothetical protein ACFL34_02240 [Candidatus Sumerlaeota bacterium]